MYRYRYDIDIYRVGVADILYSSKRTEYDILVCCSLYTIEVGLRCGLLQRHPCHQNPLSVYIYFLQLALHYDHCLVQCIYKDT